MDQSPDRDIPYALVTINHIDDDLLAPTLGHEGARVLAGLSQRVRDTENLTLACLWDTPSAEGLEPQQDASGQATSNYCKGATL